MHPKGLTDSVLSQRLLVHEHDAGHLLAGLLAGGGVHVGILLPGPML